MKRSISVVIPNYNGKHLIELYLPSVLTALKTAGVEHQIIVVDDCSTDCSVAFIRQNYPKVILIVNRENKGFSFTCNRGIEVAGMELTLLLNSDVKLSPDYFAGQFRYFDKPDTFGVMGCIMSKDGLTIEDAARFLFFEGCRIKANRFYHSQNTDDEIYTAYLSGANALIDTHKLKELNGFDEIYSPFTSEDSDLSTRAWLLGYKCYYEHQSVCYHQVSGSIRKNIAAAAIKKVYYRNRFIFLKIYLKGVRALVWPAWLLFVEVLPKLFAGHFWIVDSLKQYGQASSEIEQSVQQLEELRQAHSSNLRVKDVMRIINQSVKGKSIVRL